MPFTPAHPAAVLPLLRSKRLSVTALTAGSMAPDLEFFLQMREVENIGHHWYGVPLFDVPVALLCCIVFHHLLRNVLVAHLPPFLRQRVPLPLQPNWLAYARRHKTAVLLSLLIGIATHILWDGFTHHDGMFVSLLPVLALQAPGMGVPVYFLLQVLFSLAGMLAIAVYVYRLPLRPHPAPAYRHGCYWPVFTLIFVVLLGIRLAVWPQYNSFWGVFMAVMGGICYSWLLVSVLFLQQSIKITALWK